MRRKKESREKRKGPRRKNKERKVFFEWPHFLFIYEEEIPQLEVDSGLVDGLVAGLVDGLVENQRRLLQILKVHPFSSKQELAEQLKISTTAIDKNIKALKRKELLRRIGPDRGGHWEVLANEENFIQNPKGPQ